MPLERWMVIAPERSVLALEDPPHGVCLRRVANIDEPIPRLDVLRDLHAQRLADTLELRGAAAPYVGGPAGLQPSHNHHQTGGQCIPDGLVECCMRTEGGTGTEDRRGGEGRRRLTQGGIDPVLGVDLVEILQHPIDARQQGQVRPGLVDAVPMHRPKR
nr:hypothetical protein [Nocardia coubleae]